MLILLEPSSSIYFVIQNLPPNTAPRLYYLRRWAGTFLSLVFCRASSFQMGGPAWDHAAWSRGVFPTAIAYVTTPTRSRACPLHRGRLLYLSPDGLSERVGLDREVPTLRSVAVRVTLRLRIVNASTAAVESRACEARRGVAMDTSNQ